MMCYFTRRCAVVAAIGAAMLTAQVASAQLDYSSDLGLAFKATYPGSDPAAFPPSSPTFGDWALRGPDGTPASLIAKNGLPASGQSGWDANPTAGAPYTYFAAQWQPGVTIDPRVQGHAKHDVLWTAPASVNAGGVALTGSLEQLFENADPGGGPSRIERLSVFKNSSATATYFVDFKIPVVDGILLDRVNFGPIPIAVAPGDTLKFLVDGSGAGGSGVVTFVAWDVQLNEIAVPEPATAGLLVTGLLAFVGCRRRRW
jgi:hypothetical protein